MKRLILLVIGFTMFTNLTFAQERFSYYSFNVGYGSGFKMNLVDLNIASRIGVGGALKWGASMNKMSSDGGSGLGYLVLGPSYSFGAGNTVGTASLLAGFGRETGTSITQDEYGDVHTNSVSGDMQGVFGIGYTHRFFTNHRWNLLVGADVLNGNFGLNVGFAIGW